MNTLNDLAAENSAVSISTEERAGLEAHTQALAERARGLPPGAEQDRLRLDEASARLRLEDMTGAWQTARAAFDSSLARADWEQAAQACELLFNCGQEESLAALGMGIWLAVTYPVNPETTVTLLQHVIDETPADSDGAAVAAAVAHYIAGLRASDEQRASLTFFTSQMLGAVARRHGQAESQAQFDYWLNKLELNQPQPTLVRLRNVVDVLVQDQWWFDRDALQARLPLH
jgi:hypothetical protein